MFQVPLAGQALSSANIGIDTTITSGNISCTNISATNGTIGNLTTTVFNPASITTTTVDTANLTVSNSIPVLNVQTLNVSTKNVCQMNVLNSSITNMSVVNISCTNFTSPDVQPLLIAGDNVSILNNVISATNDALLPSNANFSSINTSSLSVNNTVVIGGTTYITDNLIVSDAITADNITADNLSTAEMLFGNNLEYVAATKTLDVNTTNTISSGNTLPITSGAVYNSLNTSPTTILSMWSYMLSESEFKLVASSVPAGGENTLCYLDITPQYEGSKIHVQFCFSYSVGGHGTDATVTEIRVGTNNNVTQTVIQMIFQEWTGTAGGGTRSGVGSSISASYTNNDSLGSFHRIQLRLDNNTDDTWSLDNSAMVSIKVTEFVEITGSSNPNLFLGSGNISCGNFSCTSLTATNHTIDNLITTQNVNVGGSMVTVGFPESGVIEPSSELRLAGGSVVSNYADAAWDGTTFNISTRQAAKNFKVSFGQVAYLEVDSTNVSVQSLRVNQTLEVVGSVTYDDLILNNTLLVNGTILADGANFTNDVIFERDVTIEEILNVSNINVSGNVVIGGTLTGTNLSTIALIPGTNITIANNVISAFVEGDADIVVASLHVDGGSNIYGSLNVSQTSNFGQSLNVDNQLFVGTAGGIDGNLVLYSTNVGDNFQIQNYSDSATGFLGTGNISKFNFSLGGNKTLSVSPTEVNILGNLIVSGSIDGTLDFENLSATNLSVVNLTATAIQGNLNAENMFGTTLTTTGHIETGKWFLGATSSTVASLYNSSVTNVSAHYALSQNDGGGTSINGNAVYFKNNGTDVGEWTATGLGIGKISPTKMLDVLGNTLITGNVNICGILDADDIVLDNISNTNFSGNQITGNQLEVTGHVETGKWLIGSSSSTVAQLYNKDVTNISAHYALSQTDGAATSINGTSVYFKNNGTNVGQWNATGLGIGKFPPEFTFDCLGDASIYGTIYTNNVCCPLFSNVSFIRSTGMIEFTTNGSPTLDLDETFSKFYHDVNISGTLTADAMANINSVNGSFTNLSTAGITTSATIDTFELIADECTVNFLTVLSALSTDEVLCDFVHATISMLCDGPLVVTGTSTLSGANISGSVNISGTLRADTIEGIDLLNICSTNISTTNLSTKNISATTLTTTGVIESHKWHLGATSSTVALLYNKDVTNVSAHYALIQNNGGGTSINGNAVYFKNNGTDVGEWTATGLGVGKISPTSTLDVSGNSLFTGNVNISGTLTADTIAGIDLANICSTNISTSNLSTNKITFYTTYGLYKDFTGATNVSLAQVKGDILSALGATFSATTLNSSTLNSSVIKARNIYVQDLGASMNFSAAGVLNNNQTGCVTNLKTCNSSTLNVSNMSCINVSVSNDLEVDGILDCFDLVSDTGTITTFDSTTINVSTINASVVNGANLSTGAFLLGSGLAFSLNTLSVDFTGVEQTIADEIAAEVDTSLVNATTANIGFLNVDGTANISTLNASNISCINLSCTELTASTIKHSDDFCRFYKSVNAVFNSLTQTSYLGVFDLTSLSSTKVTKTTTSRFTINKAGYYKICSNMMYETTSYNDRVIYRGQILLNGNTATAYGDSFVYVRHNLYGDFGSAPITTVLNLSVNDYIEVYITLKKSTGNFGDVMTGTSIRLASDIYFEYLGV